MNVRVTTVRSDNVPTNIHVSADIFELLALAMNPECAENNYSYLSGMLDDVYYEHVRPELSTDALEAWLNNWAWEIDELHVDESDWKYKLEVDFYLENPDQALED